MSAAAVLAVIVAAGEAHTPVTQALVGAASEAVGTAAVVRVAETSSQSDRAVLRVEASMDAVAAVALVWDDEQHLRARTRLHVVRSDRWIDRAIGFEPADKLGERGRALGFTIASMLPEAGSDIEVTLPESFVVREPVRDHALEVTLAGSGLSGSPDFGGTVAGEQLVSETFALRLGLVFRQGSLASDASASQEAFQGTKLMGGLAVGAAWWPLRPGPDDLFGFGLRADLLGLRLQVLRDQVGGQRDVETSGGFLAGLDLMAQGTIRLGATAEVLLAAGLEAASRPADVTLRSATGARTAVVAIPAWRALAEVGMRFLF